MFENAVRDAPRPRCRDRPRSAAAAADPPFPQEAPWIWRCHVDLSHPNAELWAYLADFIEQYDAVVFSLPEYAQKITPPQRFIMPAINPFSTTNKDLPEGEIDDAAAALRHPDRPAAGRAGVALRQMEGPAGRHRRVPHRAPRGRCDAGDGRQRGDRRSRGPGGLRIRLCGQHDERIRILSVQDSALRERAAAPGRGRAAEVDPRGLRPDGDRGDVERGRGDRRHASAASAIRSKTA